MSVVVIIEGVLYGEGGGSGEDWTGLERALRWRWPGEGLTLEMAWRGPYVGAGLGPGETKM